MGGLHNPLDRRSYNNFADVLHCCLLLNNLYNPQAELPQQYSAVTYFYMDILRFTMVFWEAQLHTKYTLTLHTLFNTSTTNYNYKDALLSLYCQELLIDTWTLATQKDYTNWDWSCNPEVTFSKEIVMYLKYLRSFQKINQKLKQLCNFARIIAQTL